MDDKNQKGAGMWCNLFLQGLMGLQIPPLALYFLFFIFFYSCVCLTSELQLHTGTAAAGPAASLRFFKSSWMKESGRKEHCAQLLLLLLLLHTGVELVFLRPTSIKWGEKKHVCVHTTQHNNFTGVSVFLMKKEEDE